MPSGNLYVLTFGDRTLAFTAEEFDAGLKRGLALAGNTATAAPPAEPEKLLSAAEMERLTEVKSAWFLEAARAGTVPHYKIGKYVRFQVSEVLACSRFRSRAAQGAGRGAP